MSLDLHETERILRSVEQSVVPEALRREWARESALEEAGGVVPGLRAAGRGGTGSDVAPTARDGAR